MGDELALVCSKTRMMGLPGHVKSLISFSGAIHECDGAEDYADTPGLRVVSSW